MKSIPLVLLLLVAACTESEPAAPETPAAVERPMDEVPVQARLANGDREYRFANGCVVVLQPARAVLKTESAVCELHHRDIALLYASGD